MMKLGEKQKLKVVKEFRTGFIDTARNPVILLIRAFRGQVMVYVHGCAKPAAPADCYGKRAVLKDGRGCKAEGGGCESVWGVFGLGAVSSPHRFLSADMPFPVCLNPACHPL